MASIAWRRAMRRFQTIAKVIKTANIDRALTRNPKRRVDALLFGGGDDEGVDDERAAEGWGVDMVVNVWPL